MKRRCSLTLRRVCCGGSPRTGSLLPSSSNTPFLHLTSRTRPRGQVRLLGAADRTPPAAAPRPRDPPAEQPLSQVVARGPLPAGLRPLRRRRHAARPGCRPLRLSRPHAVRCRVLWAYLRRDRLPCCRGGSDGCVWGCLGCEGEAEAAGEAGGAVGWGVPQWRCSGRGSGVGTADGVCLPPSSRVLHCSTDLSHSGSPLLRLQSYSDSNILSIALQRAIRTTPTRASPHIDARGTTASRHRRTLGTVYPATALRRGAGARKPPDIHDSRAFHARLASWKRGRIGRRRSAH